MKFPIDLDTEELAVALAERPVALVDVLAGIAADEDLRRDLVATLRDRPVAAMMWRQVPGLLAEMAEAIRDAEGGS